MTDKEFEALEVIKNALERALSLHPCETYAKGLADYSLAYWRERDRRISQAGKK